MSLPNKRSIRLVSFERNDNVLQTLRLRTFSYPEVPVFTALSYTWVKAICETAEDDDSPITHAATHEIKVEDKSFKVTENLYDALQQLCNEDIKFMWIDAICINETDFEERADQLLMMCNIYSSAERVIVWLGKDTSDIQSLRWLQDEFGPVFKAAGEPRSVTFKLGEALGLNTAEFIAKTASAVRWVARRR